jgi:low temperature requirement protein LtrA
VTSPTDQLNEGSIARLRRWFLRPPRAPRETEQDRTVSFLELFYDLVYVVVIAQAAHHLAGHISLEAFIQFVVILGLVWIAWLNGTSYYEFHGHEDGRTRVFVFVQMGILVLLAVFTSGAAGEDGSAFALTYLAFLLVLTYLWWTVRQRDPDEYQQLTGRYLIGMIITIAAMAVSALVDDEARLMIWAAIVIGWFGGMLLLGLSSRRRDDLDFGSTPTDSLVERFGLFTIIVLGEVVVGVVDGLSEVDLDVLTIVTGMLALIVGFGLWWIFFDSAGRRLPREDPAAFTRWMLSHFLVAVGIAAAGAAMVSLIEHAHDPSTPAATAWLMGGSVALALAGLLIIVRALAVDARLAAIYRPVSIAMLAGAVAALVVGWLQPAPWLLALLLVGILSAIWLFAVDRWLRYREPASADPVHGG